MKKIVLFFAAMSVAASVWSFSDKGQERIVMAQTMKLADMTDFTANVSYEVLLPSADEPIIYTLKMASTPNANDTFAMSDYLIEWSLNHDGKTSDGFTAYFDGNFYRYKDYRLQEYHATESTEPFAPGGDARQGIQNRTQFVDVLPQGLSLGLAEILSDSSYTIQVDCEPTSRFIVFDAVRNNGGTDDVHVIYKFDRDLLPVSYEITTNPGGMGEHVVTAVYDYSDDNIATVAHSETELADRYADAFGKYRERDFTIDNLPGRRLPAFSATTPTRERYRHTKNAGFASPTVIAILDSKDEITADYIARLRQTIDSTPKRIDLIMAFGDNDAETIETLSGSLRPGEHVLMSARGLIRDCGVTTFPTVIVCDRDGVVKDLVVGDNNDIADFVIEETADMAE